MAEISTTLISLTLIRKFKNQLLCFRKNKKVGMGEKIDKINFLDLFRFEVF